MMIFGTLISLLLLAAVVWAIINVVQSPASTGAKVAWVVLLLVVPLIGFLIWLVVGPRAVPAPSS